MEKDKVKVGRHCNICKRYIELIIDRKGFEAWQQGELIQRALPTLSPGDREFLISGICEPCFDEVFK